MPWIDDLRVCNGRKLELKNRDRAKERSDALSETRPTREGLIAIEGSSLISTHYRRSAAAKARWYRYWLEMTEAPLLSEEARISPMIEEKRGHSRYSGATRGGEDETRRDEMR